MSTADKYAILQLLKIPTASVDNDQDDDGAESDKPAAAATPAAPKKSAMELMQEMAAAEAAAEKAKAVDVPFEVKVSPDNPGVSTDLPSTVQQWDAIRDLFDSIYGHGTEIREKNLNAALAKRGCKALAGLTIDQANEIIAALRKKVESVKSAANAAVPRVEPPTPAEDPKLCGPCTPEQEREIKEQLTQWKQVDPTKYDEEMKWLKAKLAESKRTRINELSYKDAERLLSAVKVKNLQSFIQASLEAKATPVSA